MIRAVERLHTYSLDRKAKAIGPDGHMPVQIPRR